MHLVDLLDELLPRLEADPAYAHFMLDGQMAVVDDYLEIRPGGRGRAPPPRRRRPPLHGPVVRAHGRVPGVRRDDRPRPPDGPAPGRRLGGAMEVGYLPDMFGHVAQMPQILRRAGLGPRGRVAGRARGRRPLGVLVAGTRRLDGAGRVPPRGLRQRGLAPRHRRRAGRDGAPLRGDPRRGADRADPLDERHRPPDAPAPAGPPRGRGQRRPGRLRAGDHRPGRPRRRRRRSTGLPRGRASCAPGPAPTC